MTVTVVALMIVVIGCTSSDEATDTSTSTTPSTTQPTTTSTTTTTTLPEPPHLEVLDPANGATVTSARYTFNGVTDPGCTVTVGGKYEATVAEDGTWALDLMLEPGRNSTTFTATHP
jgi:ABC-type Fe3+-hydroxamate transport system substrate-binding protein